MTEFTEGKTYYTAKGQKVEMLATTTDGKFVVAELYEVEGYDGTEMVWGPTVFAEALYKAPPREIIDKEIQRLLEKQNELTERNATLRRDALDAEKDVRDRLTKLKKYKGLEYIEDFIEGRITHFVLKNHSTYDIVTLDSAIMHPDGRAYEGIKLISLFGNSKGDLTFKLNDYKDGSGGWREIVPCASEADAIQKRREIIASEILAESFAYDPKRSYHLACAVDRAIKYDVEVSSSVMEIYNDYQRETLTKDRINLEKKLAEDNEKLSALIAKIPASRTA